MTIDQKDANIKGMIPGIILILTVWVVVLLTLILLRIHIILKRERKLQQELKEERDLAKAIVTSMGEGLLVLDTNYKIQLINPAAQALLETSEKEAVGQQWAEFGKAYVGNREILFAERSAVKSLQTGKVKVTTITDDHYYVTRSGKKFPVVAITAPLTRKGTVTGIVKVFRDATKEKEIDRMKTEFISLASHQLRTPLSAIRWFIELLSDPSFGSLNQKQQEFVAHIGESTERMIELVNSLLNISRIESGRIVIEPKPTNLVELVKSVMADFQKKIEIKKLRFITSAHQDLPLLMIDAKLIRHVYSNLIDNAIKYTPDGGEVRIIISKKEDKIISQIADTGFGIPKSEQLKLFQRFYRATNIVKHVTEGTGLGLYLVKSIVESSGGNIWFKSEEDKGTTFWFSLPIEGMKAKKGEVSLSG